MICGWIQCYLELYDPLSSQVAFHFQYECGNVFFPLFGSFCLVLVHVDILWSNGAFMFMEHSGGEKNFLKGTVFLLTGVFLLEHAT